MLVRPARRLRPAVATLLAGVLLACAYLMWGAGRTSAMAMPGPMPGMAAMVAEEMTETDSSRTSPPRATTGAWR
ncbi:hypothetical protein [Streptomyces sp. NPDC051211]|uniref:hypothetical protein n=1 Tax=Streptomyces sp. NPDC051211 TaxID=3154643 RepID=UPI00344FA80C